MTHETARPGAASRPACPVCGERRLETVPVIHHTLCAYIGPEYDFRTGNTLTCPKCGRGLKDAPDAWEKIGTSARCAACGTEFAVPPEEGRS